MNVQTILLYAIIVLCLFNLLRMGLYLVTSDLYSIRLARRRLHSRAWHLPSVSVIIPAHNEESGIARSLDSIREIYYPASKLEIIVMNDGSTDHTANVVRAYARSHPTGAHIRLVNQANKGKAGALNDAMRYYARGSLIMCLDADSYIDRWGLLRAVKHFHDPSVVALSSNVNIVEDGTLLGLVQRIEYLIGYQMKKGQSLLGLEYIVGGIGSMFRRTILEQVEFYDTNTMTEDIDLTMKIILSKQRHQRIAYASDCLTYTEPAHSLRELISQRFRWKYGRAQTFLKHAQLFFSRQSHHTRRLSWGMLPFVLLQDLLFFFEPFIIGYFLYATARYGDFTIFASALIVLTTYITATIWSATHLSIRERLRLTYYAPPMYFLMYTLSYVEYYALIKVWIDAPKLRRSMAQDHVTWTSPARSTGA